MECTLVLFFRGTFTRRCTTNSLSLWKSKQGYWIHERQTDRHIIMGHLFHAAPFTSCFFTLSFCVSSSCYYLLKFVSCVKMSRSKISIACLIAPMPSTSLAHLFFLISFSLRTVEKYSRLRSCLLCSIYPPSSYFLPSASCVQILRNIVIQLETLTFT
jgi:hypothetical protein